MYLTDNIISIYICAYKNKVATLIHNYAYNLQILMNVHHLHVITPVITLLAVMSASVMLDMNWIVMEYLVMVCSIIIMLRYW